MTAAATRNDANGNPITTVTANDGSGNPGYYEFPGLPAGSYQVEFVKPGGYGFTTPDAGGDTLDSDADVTTGRSPVLTLTPARTTRRSTLA